MKYLKNVVTLTMNRDKCIGCGMCADVCPHRVFEITAGKASVIDRDACMECGACMKNCPAGAIGVTPGVGCAYAIVLGKIRGTEPTCGCADPDQNTSRQTCCG